MFYLSHSIQVMLERENANILGANKIFDWQGSTTFIYFLLNCLYSTSTWYFNTFSSYYTNIIYLKTTILTQNQQNSVHPLHNGIRFRSRKHLSTQIFFLSCPLNKMVGSSGLLHRYACMHNFHTNYIRNIHLSLMTKKMR